MFLKFVFGTALLLGAATVFSGQASSFFSVQVMVNPAGGGVAAAATSNTDGTGNTASCVSSSRSGSAGASVQVLCSTGVFVDISRSTVRVIQLASVFNTSPESPMPDNCRNGSPRGNVGGCRLADQSLFSGAGDDPRDGWQFENQRYAVNVDGIVMNARAGLRIRENRDTVTALRVSTANDPSGSLEMLVSF